MREPLVDDVVRLTSDVPHLNLHKGQSGVVRSLWYAPAVAYEVEFLGLDERTRAVLLKDQVSVDEEGAMQASVQEANAQKDFEPCPGAF